MARDEAAGALAALRESGIAAHKAGDLDAAQRRYARYLAQVPNDGGIWSNLGALFRTRGEPEQAIRAHMRALHWAPDAPGIRGNFANALTDVGRYDEAIALRRRILADKPDDPQQKALIGRAMRGKGAYDDAIDYLSDALHDHPEEAEIELQLAFAQLGAGDYEEGFLSYDARWRTGEMSATDLPYPRWQGEDLTGRTVLVAPEQGFGDAVLMMRFLPWLKERCARVICLTEKPVARLFSRLPGADLAAPEVKRSAEIDVYLSPMDLPRLGLEGPEDIPPPTRLHVPEDSAERAAELVGPHRAAFRVGVVWTGSVTYKGNAFRSFTHREFLPLTEVPGVQLFSLYKGPMVEAFLADGSDAFLIDAGSTDRDLADCAAMMQAMDLVITSDTATAHIAGSLGVPVWCVLHWDPFWVYGHEGETTPWYPSMRLFRQRTPLRWDAVFDEVREALEDLVGGEEA